MKKTRKKRKSPSEEAASDPTTTDEEKKKSDEESDEEGKKEKKKEEEGKTVEELGQAKVMKAKVEELTERKKAAKDRREKVVAMAAEIAEKDDEKEKEEKSDGEGKDAEASESEEKEEYQEVKPTKEEKKRSTKEEKKRSTKEEKRRSKDEEPPLQEVMEDCGSNPAKINLWSVFTHGGEPRQKDFASQVMEREYVRCREMLMRPLKSAPQGYGKRSQALKIQVNEHVAECIDSLSIMEHHGGGPRQCFKRGKEEESQDKGVGSKAQRRARDEKS